MSDTLSAYCELNAAFYWKRKTDDHSFEETSDLYEGFIKWKPSFIPGAVFKGGRIEFISADGYILNKDNPGVFVEYNLEPSLNWPATLKFFWSEIEEESPLFHFQYDHRIGFFEKIGLFWVGFHDENNGAADILNRQVGGGYLFESSGSWQYIGLEMGKYLGKLFLKGTYIYQFGNIDLEVWTRKKNYDISAHLFDLNLSISLGKKLGANLFYLFATGDDFNFSLSDNSQNLNTFFSIAPFIKKTNIFFNGGADDTFTSDTLSLAGSGLAGLSVPGFTIKYSGNRFDIANTWALLMAQKNQKNRGNRYGWETDFTFNRYFGGNGSFFLEVDCMHLENFFENSENDYVWKSIAGVNFCY